ncbi:phosphatase PAP2 family protein [Neolewinella antarctica]|uniref:Undecaprenyl-diphosphatase n=1 Tax=Neolewinella antarctica TaxID=442734 RepID=A0ABX0X795_9BACT|nr:phosphatase PAP2 family protein [Neolewinella antarctica]NJC25111.1 undecaprenyl-diphosphatase [Neolewinella antarctica]
MSLDYALFEFINQDLANPFFDWLLPIYRDKVTWVPAYLVVAFLLYRAYGLRRTLYLLACIGLVIGAADQLAASVLKPLVGRLRPCAEPLMMDRVRDLVGCGGKLSFPSNHATNHFALAGVLALTFLRDRPLWKTIVYCWAATICFAQVYVGKHWPGDVLGGAILGLLLAYIGVYVYTRLTKQAAIGATPPPGRAESLPSSRNHSR